jgi:hypothetical protein
MINSTEILEMDSSEARSFLLEEKSYGNFDLPFYFSFNDLLTNLSNTIGESDIRSYYFSPEEGESCLKPNDFEGVNHLILANKDGSLAWRPFELIHPALYVFLVHTITKSENWRFIKSRFEKYSDTGIRCQSLPRKSDSKELNMAEQINAWWRQVEQESLKTALEFNYVLDADISNCYGSIYTHSLCWALHSREQCKDKENRRSLLGNKIDNLIQSMRYGQTNGIPQGSVLMDFLAEILLGHVDELLTQKLSENNIRDGQYSIIRYRDDYKIFVNKPEIGNDILKYLSEVLASLGIRLNTSKTKLASDPILGSIKDDKIDELFIPHKKKNLSKRLFQIYSSLAKHPNSGKAARLLSQFYDELSARKKLHDYEDPQVMISIVVNIAIRNPRCYNWCMAIISKLMEFQNQEDREQAIKLAVSKFKVIPNTGLLELWLHRISSEVSPHYSYEEKLTKIFVDPYPGNKFWNSRWLKEDISEIVQKTKIVDFEKFEEKGMVINRKETEVFTSLADS